MFTLVQCSFLTHAQAHAIKKIWFFDTKENRSENYSRKTQLYKKDLKKIKLFNTLSIFMAGLLAVELTTTLLHSDR
jgi:uncharacterized membrane protein